MSPARVALVHDYLTQRGGAERVVLSMHRLFPEAPIYTSLHDPDGTYAEFREADVRTTFLQRLPRGWSGFSAGRGLLPLYPLAFAGLRLRGYDLVVSSSSGWAHGVRAVGAAHLCYCHTPARWLYQTDRYLDAGGPVPAWAQPMLGGLLGPLRRWDAAAARRPDLYVANSRLVAERIRTIYGRRAEVVHPPAGGPAGGWTTSATAAVPPREASRGEPYYLVVSRLLPYKRIDLAIAACAARRRRLVVVGDGPAASLLSAQALQAAAAARVREPGALVEFRAQVTEEELGHLLAGCTALIQPGEEDFGMVPLEANAAGRPVVAFGRGGALESVADGVSGVLFEEQSEDSLGSALDRLEARAWDGERLRSHARAFGEAEFHAGLSSAVERLLHGHVAPMVQLGRTS